MTHSTRNLERFYSLIARLGELPSQMRPLRDLVAKSLLPERGVYFFQEPGEARTVDLSVLRIVRVGTHAVSANSKATLYRRLKTHLGTRGGTGNHRGSIFRLHIGTALLARDKRSVPTWGIGSSAPATVRDCAIATKAERECERLVSDFLGGMSVLWLNVSDEPGPKSVRGFIERNAIALLSNQLAPVDAASESWLGRFSPRQEIRDGGLWNVRYVRERYDPTFLDRFESYVSAACQGRPRGPVKA